MNVESLERFLDEIESAGKFSEKSEIVSGLGWLELHYDGKVICDTSQCDNLVNPHQINDVRLLKHSIDLCRFAIDIAEMRPFSLSQLKKTLSDAGDLEQSPISPFSKEKLWHVLFEYNGWQEIDDMNGALICHNRCSSFRGKHLFWIMAKAPTFYTLLSKATCSKDAFTDEIFCELRDVVGELADERVRYWEKNDSKLADERVRYWEKNDSKQ